MNRFSIAAVALALLISANCAVAADNPAETIRRSELVLSDLMSIPGRQIPQHLLAEATAVAVIPDVTKIGFIAGVRRGHGVLMVRDAEGDWSLPQFITLTGGSVGGQAGIQGTDVVLVFKTRKGVEGLMKGKFTIGVDASVSAGPVGRDTEAATDAALKAEILSYSRSRGLFLGVAIDGSALEIDHFAHREYYGSGSAELPHRIPESATQFRHYLAELAEPAEAAPATTLPPVISPRRLEALRRSLIHHAEHLHATLPPNWRQYLALPRDVMDPAATPNLEALTTVEEHFARIASTPIYRRLAENPEFHVTHELLREYIHGLSSLGPVAHIPPPLPLLTR